MRIGLVVLLIVVAVAAVAALNALFIINPTQQALVLQFGQVRDTIRDPGLNTKIPFVQDVLILDKRILDLNVPAQEIIAADQKRLVVDAFMRYRIRNPVQFYQTVNNVEEGAERLNTFVQASLRAVLADATFQDIVRDNRPALMQRIKADVAARAENIGIEVYDVRIRRADLPEANSEAIFRRMQTERRQEADEIRAQGDEAARRITAAADRTATVLRAEASREGEQIRGEGDGRKNAIFARAFSLDPQFFAFYRAMQAYEESLASQDTRLVLSPDADFFRYFSDPSGVQRQGVRASGQLSTLPQSTGAAPDRGTASAEPADGEPVEGAEGPQPVAEAEAALPEPASPEEAEAETAAAREEIESIRREVEPRILDPALGTDLSDLEAAIQRERNETIQDVTPAEVSTEAAVETATPPPSDPASAAAAGDAGGEAPAEALPSATDAGSTQPVEAGDDAGAAEVLQDAEDTSRAPSTGATGADVTIIEAPAPDVMITQPEAERSALEAAPDTGAAVPAEPADDGAVPEGDEPAPDEAAALQGDGTREGVAVARRGEPDAVR
ncbi:SPFH domain-containing protein [Acuticoccus sp.]|uniref:SPFH domain-containing protein n=1 Tax=Acuticoccus sp. TaxID=1904378 RepID=UPI003B52284E